MKKRKSNTVAKQLTFLSVETPYSETNSSKDSEIELVSFRDLVPEINDTGYLTHSIYYYPAKFIPHVVRYAIKSFTREYDWIVDPFAGSGTVGLETYFCKRNSFLLDLNPLLNHIIPVKIYRGKEKLGECVLFKMLDSMTKSEYCFIPKWSNVEYWYPPEMLDVLSKYWGWIKNVERNIYSLIIESSLLRISKHFSYAEHRAPKLFKSKSKLKYIDELLKTNWVDKLNKMIISFSLETLRSINEFAVLTRDHDNVVQFEGGVDSTCYQFDPQIEFDALITSPPYLQAQEYIRTAKMDLYWLGYNDENIRKLSRLEIPYRKPDRVIYTRTLEKIKTELARNDLIKLLDSYFCHTVSALENSMNKLKKNSVACIFVGNPVVDGIEVKIWRILEEYFTERGYSFKRVYEDKIKNRQLFGLRKNKNPDGMKSEFLLVLRKGI